MRDIRIGIDLDDVLWHLVAPWLRRFNDITGDNLKPEDIKSWDIARYLNKGSPEMLFYILEQTDFWENVDPIEGAQTYLKKLIDDGYDIYIVTASSYKVLRSKMTKFLELFPFINESQIIITKQKDLIDLHVLIDDNENNIFSGSYQGILFEQPHNEWVWGICDNLDVWRFSNWEDIYRQIREKFPIGGREE